MSVQRGGTADRRQGDDRWRAVLNPNMCCSAAPSLQPSRRYTVLTTVVAPLQIEVFSPDLRVVIETVGLSVSLFTALALLLPGDGEVGVPRDAFVAALVALGVSNAVFGVGPVLLRGETATGSALGFYPWLIARYAAGLLFIAATVGRPRLGVRH